MCLIDEVMDWNPTEICCRTASHRLISNPLRTMGTLRSECGIEYGAQAIAIHGALTRPPSSGPPTAGMLASIRGVSLHVRDLDNIAADLVIRGTRVSGNANALMYDFAISAEATTLLTGRATIVLGQPLVAPADVSLRQ